VNTSFQYQTIIGVQIALELLMEPSGLKLGSGALSHD